MADTIEAAGYIAHNGLAILGAGKTPREAWDSFSDVLDDPEYPGDDGGDGIEFSPASAALLAQVAAEGGCISWREVDGVQCTLDEVEG